MGTCKAFRKVRRPVLLRQGLADETRQSAAADDGVNLQESFQVLAKCDNEEQQTEVLDWLASQGIKCRALLS